MAEYKIVGYKWDNASTLPSVYSGGYSAKKYEANAAADDLSYYGSLGWRVVNSWRTDTGTIWFVLER